MSEHLRRAGGPLRVHSTIAAFMEFRYTAGMRHFRQTGCSASFRSARSRKNRGLSGFGLVELLCVLVIILLLTALYWNSGSSKEGRMKLCARNLEKAYLALQIYANDSHGRYPVVAAATTSEDPLSLLVPRYTVDTSVFTCPASHDPQLPSGEPFQSRKISYAYYMGEASASSQAPLMSDRQVDGVLKGTGADVFSSTGNPPGNNHGAAGGNFLFCDGSVQPTSPRISFSLVITQGVTLLNPKP